MLVKKASFERFINLIKLEGEIENKEALLTITKENIVTFAIANNKAVALKGTFKGKFAELGEIAVDNLILLSKVLTLFTENIKVTKDKNRLVLEDKDLQVACVLRNPEYIVNNKVNNVKLDDKKYKELKDAILKEASKFILPKSVLTKILAYVGVLNSSEFRLIGKGKELTLSTADGENEIIGKFKIDNELNFNIKLGRPILNVLSAIGNDVKVVAKDKSTVYLNLETEDINLELLVAPLKD